MANRKPAPKFIPRDAGSYVPMTEADIARAAEITPEDVASAKAMWRRHATPKLKRLLDAKPRKGKA